MSGKRTLCQYRCGTSCKGECVHEHNRPLKLIALEAAKEDVSELSEEQYVPETQTQSDNDYGDTATESNRKEGEEEAEDEDETSDAEVDGDRIQCHRKRYCIQCRHKKYSRSVHDGRHTRCCVSCAKAHDPKWHAALVAATDSPVKTFEEYYSRLNGPEPPNQNRATCRRRPMSRHALPAGWYQGSAAALTHLSCGTCKRLLSIQNFSSQSKNIWGYYNNCKTCETDHNKGRLQRPGCWTRAMYKHMAEHSLMRNQPPPEWKSFGDFAAWWAHLLRRQQGAVCYLFVANIVRL